MKSDTRFMIEFSNNSVEFANENGSNYISTDKLEPSDLIKIEALLSELDSYFPKPKIKEISSVNATIPNAGLDYMAVNIIDTNNNPINLYYVDFTTEQKEISTAFFAIFPEFKTIQVTQISPAVFVVDGIESKFEDYSEEQKESIDKMGIMLTKLIN